MTASTLLRSKESLLKLGPTTWTVKFAADLLLPTHLHYGLFALLLPTHLQYLEKFRLFNALLLTHFLQAV